jgi:hypothetical protein
VPGSRSPAGPLEVGVDLVPVDPAVLGDGVEVCRRPGHPHGYRLVADVELEEGRRVPLAEEAGYARVASLGRPDAFAVVTRLQQRPRWAAGVR